MMRHYLSIVLFYFIDIALVMFYNFTVMKQENQVTYEQFEIDEKTSQIKAVDIEKCSASTDNKKETSSPTKLKTIGKQLVMSQLLGIDNATSRRQRIFKTVTSITFISLVLVVLAWTFFNDFASGEPLPSWKVVIKTFGDNWYFLALAFVAILLTYLFKALKLSIMCKSMTKKWHFKTCFETGIFGIYYNNVTPLAVGGQPFEINYLSKHGVHGGVSSSLPIASYFLNQLAFVILGVTSLILFSSNALDIPLHMIDATPTITSILAIIGLFLCMLMPILVVTFSFMPKFGAMLVKFLFRLGSKLKIIKKPEELKYKTTKNVIHNSKCLKKIATNPLVFISSFILSFGETLASCSIAYLTLKFFGFNWPAEDLAEWAQVVQLCLILYAAISFIPTPGNSGAADLSFYLLFKTGLTDSGYSGFAFPAMLTWRILSFYIYIIIGFILSVRKRHEHFE